MLAHFLQRRGVGEYIRFTESRCGNHSLHFRRAFSKRAGLVHHQRIDLFHEFEGLGVFDQHAFLRSTSDTNHDGNRRGEPQRTGARDDEHGHRDHQRVGERGCGPHQRPDGEGDQRHRDHAGNEPAGHLIGEFLNRRP